MFFVILALAGQVSAGPPGGIDDASYAQTLKKYVNERGQVNYIALKRDHAGLDKFIQEISVVSPANAPQVFPTRDEQLAYWINAYNASILKIVMEHYPVKSITRIGLIPFSAFYLEHVVLGGTSLTLNALETGILRSEFHDPRIHFAINCASRSCPPLSRHVYRAATLDPQLNSAARNFVNDNLNVTLDEGQHRIVLSRIFKWYAGDFESAVPPRAHQEPTVLDYLQPYLTPQRKVVLSHLKGAVVSYHSYDWSLNSQ